MEVLTKMSPPASQGSDRIAILFEGECCDRQNYLS